MNYRWRASVLALCCTVLVASCGSNGDADGAQALYKNAGCAGCHGSEGEGRVGPPLVNLYGSDREVTNTDGDKTEVFADGEYIRRSITDPAAEQVVGYNQKMPTANLTPEQVEELVVYIESLSSVPPDVTLATDDSIADDATPDDE